MDLQVKRSGPALADGDASVSCSAPSAGHSVAHHFSQVSEQVFGKLGHFNFGVSDGRLGALLQGQTGLRVSGAAPGPGRPAWAGASRGLHAGSSEKAP